MTLTLSLSLCSGLHKKHLWSGVTTDLFCTSKKFVIVSTVTNYKILQVVNRRKQFDVFRFGERFNKDCNIIDTHSDKKERSGVYATSKCGVFFKL